MSSISSFDISSVVFWWKDPRIFLCIPASAADAALVNPNGIKTLLANGFITFFINGSRVFNNAPRSLPKNPRGCTILDNWVFDNLISVDELFAKILRRFWTCLLVNRNLREKLVSSSKLPTIFDDSPRTTPFSFLLQTLLY